MRLRLRNPSTTGWALIAGSVATLTAIGLSAAVVQRRRRTKADDLPTVDDVDDDEIVVEPTQPGNSWPGWEIKTPTDPGYPWNGAVLHYDNWPTPGMFVDIGDAGGAWKPSQGFDSLVRALLGSALTLAGHDGPDAVAIAEAEGQDPNALLGRRLRRDVRRALTAVGTYNDILYGQTNANYAGGVDPGKPCSSGSSAAPCEDGIRDPNATAVTYMMNAQGRGLNWLPRHADMLNLIGDGMMLERTTALDGARMPNLGGRQMVLFCPAFDLKFLRPDLPESEMAIEFLAYPDGSSTVDAPPAVRALGINLNGVSLPGVPSQASVQLP